MEKIATVRIGRGIDSRGVTRLIFGIIILVASFLCFWNLNSSASPGDESIHWNVIQGMRQEGTFLSPSFQGKLYLSKPPLKMWLTFLPLAAFGDSNFSYRVIDALAGVGTVVLTLLFALTLLNSRSQAILSAIFLTISPIFLFDHGARYGSQDSLLLFLSLLSLYILRDWLCQSGNRRAAVQVNAELIPFKRAVIFGLLVGAAVLTKWIAGLFPWCVICLTLLLQRRLLAELTINRRAFSVALLLSLLPAALYISQHLLTHWNDVMSAFTADIQERLFTRGLHNKRHPLFYLSLLVSRYSAAPVAIAVTSILCLGWEVGRGPRGGASKLDYPRVCLLFAWGVLTIFLYSFLRSRLQWYILPALPALSITAAWLVGGLFGNLQRLPLSQGSQRLVQGLFWMLLLFLTYPQVVRSYATVTHDKNQMRIDAITDQLVRSLSSDAERSILFFRFDPKVEQENVVSRREQFYLGKLRPFAQISQNSSDISLSSWRIIVTPTENAEEVSKLVHVSCRTKIKLKGNRQKSPITLAFLVLAEQSVKICE